MMAQLAEIKSRTELNRAQTRAADKKAEFWDRALAGLSENRIVLELRNSSETVKHVIKNK